MRTWSSKLVIVCSSLYVLLTSTKKCLKTHYVFYTVSTWTFRSTPLHGCCRLQFGFYVFLYILFITMFCILTRNIYLRFFFFTHIEFWICYLFYIFSSAANYTSCRFSLLRYININFSDCFTSWSYYLSIAAYYNHKKIEMCKKVCFPGLKYVCLPNICLVSNSTQH